MAEKKKSLKNNIATNGTQSASVKKAEFIKNAPSASSRKKPRTLCGAQNNLDSGVPAMRRAAGMTTPRVVAAMQRRSGMTTLTQKSAASKILSAKTQALKTPVVRKHKAVSSPAAAYASATGAAAKQDVFVRSSSAAAHAPATGAAAPNLQKGIWHALGALFATLIIGLLPVANNLFIRSAIPEAREYTIEQGASVSGVARDLGQGDAFKFFIRMYGNKVMAGAYDIPAGASVWRLAKMTANGEIASVSVTIPEGLTIKQIVNMLNGNEFLSGKVTRHADDGGCYNDGEMHAAWICYKEGELFPDTYVVAKGIRVTYVLELMRKKMEKVRASLPLAGRIPAPLADWNDVLTLASIVQKETPKVSEMPVVASVYLNRLRKKMRLQADPTVVYALTDGLGDMQEKHLYLKHLQIDSPYNTYKNRGLPPAPIANVGMDAISAVLNPADTNYYYFVADGKGGHSFSRTLEEHNRFRAVWREIKKAKDK